MNTDPLRDFRSDELAFRRDGYCDAADCMRNAADAIERGARPGSRLYTLAGWRCVVLSANQETLNWRDRGDRTDI